MRRTLFLLLLLSTYELVAQEHLTILYRNGQSADTTKHRINLVAANDSVSFETWIGYLDDIKMPRLPYGSGFKLHNHYVDLKRFVLIFQTQPMGDKKFLVTDSLPTIEWILHPDEKQIIGYTCRRATAVIRDRLVTVWYAPSIPVPFGPNGLVGPLGLVLEADYGPDRTKFVAVKLFSEVGPIVEPSIGKSITREAFNKRLGY